MTYPIRELVLRNDHRLFGNIRTLLVINASLAKAFTVTAGLRLSWNVGDYANFQSAQFDHLEVRLPLVGPLELAIADTIPNSIAIAVCQSSDPALPVKLRGSQQAIYNSIITSVFVEFFENNVDWLVGNVNSDRSKWPPIWNFARIVRNAMSHGGTINIDSPLAQPASWYSLTYGPAQNKRAIFGVDLVFADIFVLLLEMADELDRLGCPA